MDGEEAAVRKGNLRVAAAGLVVAAGVFGLTPSFDFDSDRDGVADSSEIYELGTDPSTADLFENPFVADR